MKVLNNTEKELIEEIQCPGCVAGSDVDCGSFKLEREEYVRCTGHVLGTSMNLAFHIALGLPRGFNRPGGWRKDFHSGRVLDNTQPLIRIWTDGMHPEWNEFNIPVWAMDGGKHGLEGVLYVRTYMPRNGWVAIDVIKGGKREELCPNAIDVATFIDEID